MIITIKKPSIKAHILQNYKKSVIKMYCYENGIKLRGNKAELVQNIFEIYGDDCALGDLNWKPVIDTTLFGSHLNEVEKSQVEALKREIYSTMQHGCLNITRNNSFGNINKSTFFKIFQIPREIGQRKHQGWHSNNKKRKIDGVNSKELYLSKNFKNDEDTFDIPEIFESIIQKSYTCFEKNYYNKKMDLFYKEEPRKWRFALIELGISYNVNREKLKFSTCWVRQAYNEREKVWEERC
jgi:hypothetical protein